MNKTQVTVKLNKEGENSKSYLHTMASLSASCKSGLADIAPSK